jgi:uncharacterized membrane protein
MGFRKILRPVVIILAATLPMQFVSCATPRAGPDGRVRVLYTGDAISPGYPTPYMFMRIEPLIQVTPVIASQIVATHFFGMEGLDMVRRAIRLYMPRNLRQLTEGYDVVIISDSTLVVFTTNQLSWMVESVEDEGLGIIMAGGHESFHMGGWQVTQIADILPVDMLPDQSALGFGRIIEPDHELMSSIPWEDGGFARVPFGGANMGTVRQGAIELAVLQETTGREVPMMITGESGKGRTFAFMPDWTFGGGYQFSVWEYYGDFANNLMLFLAAQNIPQDIEILHQARRELVRLDISRGLLVSMFEFVEKFGANPLPLEEMLDQVDDLKSRAEAAYINQDFTESLKLIIEAIAETEAAEEEAVRVKNSTLFWIYVIEWLVVTATLMISGMVVWGLMVRRKYFREVRSTRFIG